MKRTASKPQDSRATNPLEEKDFLMMLRVLDLSRRRTLHGIMADMIKVDRIIRKINCAN